MVQLHERPVSRVGPAAHGAGVAGGGPGGRAGHIEIADDYDRAGARRRLTEAADGWRRHLGHDPGAEFVANFVDLGRPPIVGLVEPEWELRRLTAELAGLDELTEVP